MSVRGKEPSMDAEGARELARRIGSNPESAARPVPADAPAGALPLYQWFGGGTAARTAEPSARAERPSLRRLRFRNR
jgi:hypothetical protein